MMLYFVIGIIIGIFITSIFHNFHNKYDGALEVGKNEETGATVLRFVYNKNISELINRKKLVFKVEKTDKNFGINKTLYDLNAEGINISQK
jgi:hypothetical protein